MLKDLKIHDDADAAHKLVTSHLRLVAKIAMGYRGYGLPVTDLISEGNVGIMQAVKKFDPEKRIQAWQLMQCGGLELKFKNMYYIVGLLVKIGTTAAQKKLFFNLKKLKNQLTFN